MSEEIKEKIKDELKSLLEGKLIRADKYVRIEKKTVKKISGAKKCKQGLYESEEIATKYFEGGYIIYEDAIEIIKCSKLKFYIKVRRVDINPDMFNIDKHYILTLEVKSVF